MEVNLGLEEATRVAAIIAAVAEFRTRQNRTPVIFSSSDEERALVAAIIVAVLEFRKNQESKV